MAKRLLVLSVDAMVTEDVDAIRSMPNFRKYLAGGSEFRGGMRTIYPSVTYPIHVSILTGCYAGKHQITSNFKFTTTTVSYTHLDVYKRQTTTRICSPRPVSTPPRI